MLSWILIGAEIAAMFAILWLLEGKRYQRYVLLAFAALSAAVGCLALCLAEEHSDLMQLQAILVPLFCVMHLPKKRK